MLSSLSIKLPPSPSGKTGWPWTIESTPLPPLQPDGNPWPRISIITPSYNQGRFIEETLRSIVLQNYPNLEYIIIDGGSTDETPNIIDTYRAFISYYVCEPDKGQSDAINKGFQRCTGKYVNWICSDDLLCPNALNNIAPLLLSDKNIFLLGNGYRIDKDGTFIDTLRPSEISDFNELVDIPGFWRKSNSILQQSALFPLEAVKEAGYLNRENHYTMDYELWGKFLLNGLPVVRTEINIGIFRWYKGQKTSDQRLATKSLVKTAQKLVFSNPRTTTLTKILQLAKILKYRIKYQYWQFRSFLGIKKKLGTLFHA